jgi:hypothetical protein
VFENEAGLRRHRRSEAKLVELFASRQEG